MNGNVGIGTWKPLQPFQVNPDALPFTVDANSNVGIGTNIISNGALSVMNGNVGIGTWKPLQPFQVNPDALPFIVDANSHVGIGTSLTTTCRRLAKR